MTVRRLPIGTYWIWVDAQGAGGLFDLDVTLGPPGPPNDDCGGVQALSVINNVASVSVDTNAAAADTVSSGCGGSGPDVVYSLTTNAAHAISAVVTPDGASPGWQPVVYLRSVCNDDTAAAELGCGLAGAPGDPGSAIINNARPGHLARVGRRIRREPGERHADGDPGAAHTATVERHLRDPGGAQPGRRHGQHHRRHPRGRRRHQQPRLRRHGSGSRCTSWTSPCRSS